MCSPWQRLIYVIIVVCWVDSSGGRREIAGFVVSGIVTSIFIASYWILLWRKSVIWNQRRPFATLAAAGAAIMIAIVLAIMIAAVVRYSESFPAFVGTVAAPLLWLVATVFICRRPNECAGHSVTASVVCPACNYNMTGLTTARCPECGAEFTLDQLFSSQPDRESKELNPLRQRKASDATNEGSRNDETPSADVVVPTRGSLNIAGMLLGLRYAQRRAPCGLPGIAEVLAGQWEKHSQFFYQQRAIKMGAAIAPHPDNLAAYDNLAVALEKLGDHDGGLSVLRQKEKIAPGQYTTFANMGTIYLHQGAVWPRHRVHQEGAGDKSGRSLRS